MSQKPLLGFHGLEEMGALPPRMAPRAPAPPPAVTAPHPMVTHPAVSPSGGGGFSPPMHMPTVPEDTLPVHAPARGPIMAPAVGPFGPMAPISHLAPLAPVAHLAHLPSAGQQLAPQASSDQGVPSPFAPSSDGGMPIPDTGPSGDTGTAGDTSSVPSFASKLVSKTKQTIAQATGKLPPPRLYGAMGAKTPYSAAANGLAAAGKHALKTAKQARSAAAKATGKTKVSGIIGAIWQPKPKHVPHAIRLSAKRVEAYAKRAEALGRDAIKSAPGLNPKKLFKTTSLTAVHGLVGVLETLSDEELLGLMSTVGDTTDTSGIDTSATSGTDTSASDGTDSSSGDTSSLAGQPAQDGSVTDLQGNPLYPPVFDASGNILYPSPDPNVTTPPTRDVTLSEADAESQVFQHVPDDGIPYPVKSSWNAAGQLDEGFGSARQFYGGTPNSQWSQHGGFAMHGNGWFYQSPGDGNWYSPNFGEQRSGQVMQNNSLEHGWGPLIGNPAIPQTAGLQFAQADQQWFWQADHAPSSQTQDKDSKILEANVKAIQTGQAAALATLAQQMLAAQQQQAAIQAAQAQAQVQQIQAQGQAAQAQAQQQQALAQWVAQNPEQAAQLMSQGGGGGYGDAGMPSDGGGYGPSSPGGDGSDFVDPFGPGESQDPFGPGGSGSDAGGAYDPSQDPNSPYYDPNASGGDGTDVVDPFGPGESQDPFGSAGSGSDAGGAYDPSQDPNSPYYGAGDSGDFEQ